MNSDIKDHGAMPAGVELTPETVGDNSAGEMSAEDEAKVAAILGNPSMLSQPELTPKQVEERARLHDQAVNYDIEQGKTVIDDAIQCIFEQGKESMDVLNHHATLEWNQAILTNNKEKVEYLKKLNKVRFLGYAQEYLDKAIVILREFNK